MGKKCFAPNCRSGYVRRKNDPVPLPGDKVPSIFSAPKEEKLIKKWQQAIPRSDKLFDKKSFLCELHFSPDMIENRYTNLPTDVDLFPKGKLTLKLGAVPSIWPGCPSNLTKAVGKKRKQPTKRELPPVSKRQKEDTSLPNDDEEEPGFTEDLPFSFAYNWGSLKAPSGWFEITEQGGQKLQESVKIFYQLKCLPDMKVIPLKAVKIDLELKVVHFYYLSERSDSMGENPKPFDDINTVTHILETFNNLKICSGIRDPKFLKIPYASNGKVTDGIWQSHKCSRVCTEDDGHSVGDESICPNCQILKLALNRRLLRMKKAANQAGSGRRTRSINLRKLKKAELIAQLQHQRKVIANLKRALERDRQRIQRLKDEAKVKMEEMKKFQNSAVDDLLQPLGRQAKQMVKTILKQAKAERSGKSKGMRYEADWLLECLLLRIKSSSVYNHLREMKLLPLPHPGTLGRMLGAMSCEFGFNKTALEAILKAPPHEREGVLSCDELKIAEEFKFNSQTLCFDGMVKLKDRSYDEANDNSKPLAERIADHGLVFMFRSLKGKWVQPFGIFASRNAASGLDLFRLMISATIQLEDHGARVLAFVCDGAQSNKNMWSRAGIEIKKDRAGVEKINNSMIHPTVPEARIWFLLDPPHAFKCIRNQIFNHGTVQAGGAVISHDQIKTLFNVDELVSKGGKKVCWKLRNSHINPTCTQKMNVKLAVQVLSESVAIAFNLFRNSKTRFIADQFRGTENIERIFRLLDKTFDFLNSRRPMDALRPGSLASMKETFDELEELLVETIKVYEDKIAPKYPPPFVSLTTLKGLRITMKSVVEISAYLFEKGYRYVLTGKLNQDCLERFFGIIRASNGTNEMPTASSFLQLFRMISLYYPTKRALRGSNVDSEEEYITVLTDYSDWLKRGFKENQLKMNALKKFTRDILLNGIQIELESANDGVSDQSTISDNIVYYMGGYLVCKYKKRNGSCQDCIDTIDHSAEDLPEGFSAHTLTTMKSYGYLRYASHNLFKLLIKVEEEILLLINEGGIFEPSAFTDLLTSLCDSPLPKIGCDLHHLSFMSNVVIDFLCSRMKCIGRQKSLELTEQKRAKAKTLRKTSML